MALASTTVWEIETTGSATLNGGAFDPGQTAGMNTDGAATSATGTAPVFSSASYNFVAGDVGAWVYIASGTNWTPGWYKVSSVAANAATLNATIGQAVLAAGTPTTAAGCATTASPTGATWSIDYSQQSAAQFTYTDLASTGAGSTCSSVAFPFGKQQVGNSIRITGGTNFTTGVYVIASVTTLVATVIGAAAMTTGAGVSGTGGQGGAMSTFAAVVSFQVAGNLVFVQTGTYTITTTISISLVNNLSMQEFRGYGSVRGDNGTRPIVTCATNSVHLFTLQTGPRGYKFYHLKFTHTASTRGTAFLENNSGLVYNFTWEDCIIDGCLRGIHSDSAVANGLGFSLVSNTEITNCINEGIRISGTLTVDGCFIHNNGAEGIRDLGGAGAGAGSWVLRNSIFYANTGRGVYGTNTSAAPNTRGLWQVFGCAFVSNTGSGLDIAPTGSPTSIVLTLDSNIFDSNGAFGVTLVQTPVALFNRNNAYRNNTSGNRSNLPVGQGDIVLTGSPFTNPATGDFSLNNTAGSGAACRAAGFPGVLAVGGTGYIDIGPLQHQDSGGSSVFAVQVQNTVIVNRFGVAGY